MRKRLTNYFTGSLLFLAMACNSSSTTSENPGKDSVASSAIRFGIVQPLIENNSSGEKLLRIDSMMQADNQTTFYYTTDKGSRTYTHNSVFKTTILSAYKPDGSRDCFVKTGGGISKCYDAGCTIVVDTDYVQHPYGPYPLLPGADTSSKPCPPIEVAKKS